MKYIIVILLIATFVCAKEENKTNPFDKIKEGFEDFKNNVTEKFEEIKDDTSKQLEFFKNNVTEKFIDFKDDISGKAKELAKNFKKFFEKLGEDIQKAIVWLKENGYWDKIIEAAETVGKMAAITACKVYFVPGAALCEPIVNFIFEAIISIIDKIKNKIEQNKEL